MNKESTVPDACVARHAVVTGAASGIGMAIAQALLDAGWRVTGLDRALVPVTHPAYCHHAVDLLDTNAVDAVGRRIGGIDGIVHAAGFMSTAVLGELDAGEAELMWRIHVLAAQTLVNAALGGLHDGARIVLIGSRTAFGAAGKSAYAAAKSALLGMARSWALELIARGITVNVIAPAATATPMLSDSRRADLAPRMPPLGRYVRPDEVAALALHLMGPFGQAITGQHITVCAGSSL